MSSIYEVRTLTWTIEQYEAECQRLRAANAQITKERGELEAELFNEVEQLRESYNKSIAQLEARVKRYREALEWIHSSECLKGRPFTPWPNKFCYMCEALAETKADSEGA